MNKYISSTTFLYCLITSSHKHVTKVHLWHLLQVEDDLRQGVTGAVPIPHADEGKEKVIAAMVSNVEAMIRADRKITALKELQVRKKRFRFFLSTSIHYCLIKVI